LAKKKKCQPPKVRSERGGTSEKENLNKEKKCPVWEKKKKCRENKRRYEGKN